MECSMVGSLSLFSYVVLLDFLRMFTEFYKMEQSLKCRLACITEDQKICFLQKAFIVFMPFNGCTKWFLSTIRSSFQMPFLLKREHDKRFQLCLCVCTCVYVWVCVCVCGGTLRTNPDSDTIPPFSKLFPDNTANILWWVSFLSFGPSRECSVSTAVNHVTRVNSSWWETYLAWVPNGTLFPI
jgi:hypothetical protein